MGKDVHFSTGEAAEFFPGSGCHPLLILLRALKSVLDTHRCAV